MSEFDPESPEHRPRPGESRWLSSDVAVNPPELRQTPESDAGPSSKRSGGEAGGESSKKHSAAERPRADESSGNRERGEGDALEKKRPLTEEERKKKRRAKRKARRRRTMLIVALAVLVVAAVAVAVPWYLHAKQFETTDDAFIDAHYEKVGPQVAGRVRRVLVNDNQDVRAGDVLLEIDPADFVAETAQTKASLLEARAKVEQQEAQEAVALAGVAQAESDRDVTAADLKNAEAELERYAGLSQESQIKQRLDDLKTAVTRYAAQLKAAEVKIRSAKAQVQLARAQTDAAKASVAAAQAQLDAAELRLSYTTLKATISGRVTNRTVQAGDYVAIGRELLVIVPEDVWVQANYKETQLTDMKPGQEVTVSVDAYPEHDLRGHIDSIQRGSGAWFSLLPPENATGNYVKVVQRVPVKIVFDDKGNETYKLLGPGMSVVPKVKVR